MSKTFVETLIKKKSDNDEEDENDEEEVFVFNPDVETSQIRRHAMDLFSPLDIRLQYLELFYNRDPTQFGELISCINGMYSFSRTVSLKAYVIGIAWSSLIPIVYRIDCAKNVNDEGYPILNQLCHNPLFAFEPTPIRVETVLYLMKIGLNKKEKEPQVKDAQVKDAQVKDAQVKDVQVKDAQVKDAQKDVQAEIEKYRENARNFFCEIVNDVHVDCLYRFKLIQRLENDFKDDLFHYYADVAALRFVESHHNHLVYRVICCQYMFQKCDAPLHIFANEFLLHIASLPDVSEDIRADACDILLAYGTPENVENARMILFVLGGGERARHNIFKNSQNVHNHAVEESVEKMIEYISTFVPRTVSPYTFEKAKDDLTELIKAEPDEAKRVILENAMVRITIDRAIYGRFHLSLAHIIAKMWTYIQDSPHRDELQKRLLEELIDSNNKCSSGYVSRIVNTLSGFGDMSLQISFEDQIVTVLETRLNAEIMNDENADTILDEMTLPVRFFEKRGTFLKFFRTHISRIREEMYEEFKEYVNTYDYDMYFRKAIMHYEGLGGGN
jgi:hypothetical protein